MCFCWLPQLLHTSEQITSCRVCITRALVLATKIPHWLIQIRQRRYTPDTLQKTFWPEWGQVQDQSILTVWPAGIIQHSTINKNIPLPVYPWPGWKHEHEINMHNADTVLDKAPGQEAFVQCRGKRRTCTSSPRRIREKIIDLLCPTVYNNYSVHSKIASVPHGTRSCKESRTKSRLYKVFSFPLLRKCVKSIVQEVFVT